MPAVDGNAGSAVTVGGTRGVFLRPLAIALAATVLMGAAPVAAQIAIPIPNFRFVVPHQGGGVYHHHRAYHIRGIQKPGDTGPNAPTVPPAQNGGPSPGGAAPVPLH